MQDKDRAWRRPRARERPSEKREKDICHVMDCNGSDIFISLMDDSARNEARNERGGGMCRVVVCGAAGVMGGAVGVTGSWPSQARSETHGTGSRKLKKKCS